MSWKDAKGKNKEKKIQCLNCGKIVIQKSIIDKKYCSKLCQGYYWKKTNPEKVRLVKKKNLEKILKDDPDFWKKIWQRRKNSKAHKNYRETARKKSREFYRKKRLLVLERYGNKCCCCGESRNEFLCIDHINGGGVKHRKLLKGKMSISEYLIKNNFPKGYQVLCHNCNSAKGFYGYCPHEKAGE